MLKYENIFNFIVNGQTKNIFSKNDRILYLYCISQLTTEPIGRNPIYISPR